MMFALKRSKLLRQLPDLNEIIRRLAKNMNQVTQSEHIYCNRYTP